MSELKVLLTGATGYIGKRLLPYLQDKGHHVVCCVRDANRFIKPDNARVSVVECDFLNKESLSAIPEDIDVAYYLIHSMTSSVNDFDELEARTAINFAERMSAIGTRQVIYLSGITNENELSSHLLSRRRVEDHLNAGDFHLTVLRAGIILGSGSASFEIMRDLVEKLPVMVAPKWILTRSQPVAIRNVIEFLTGVLLYSDAYDQTYDIGGPDVMSYKEMLLRFARKRGLWRRIITVPVLTPRLSSYWLFFVTSISFPLAVNLVDSMKVEVIARPNDLAHKLGIRLLTFEEAVSDAFKRVEQNLVKSSWKDSLVSSGAGARISPYIQVPQHGCFTDRRACRVDDRAETIERIWSLGGETGWYYANVLWKMRGFVDKLVGGVGLRRGRTNSNTINPGDALDFWRVLLADKAVGRLLLFAEMKLPGEAWLEFSIDQDNVLHQVATFRPRGLRGRFYWYAVWPFHGLVFNGMLKKLAGK